MTCSLLVGGLEKYKEQMKVVTFVLQNSDTQAYFMERVKKQRGEDTSTTSKPLNSSQMESEYF